MNNQDKENYENVTLGDLASDLIVAVVYTGKEIIAPIVYIAISVSLLIGMLGALTLAIISIFFRWDKYTQPDSFTTSFFSDAFITGFIVVIVFIIVAALWSKASGIVVYRQKIPDDEVPE